MPTYSYVCEACGHKFNKFQSMMDESLKNCPQCHQRQLRRLIGAGAGLIFKGSGFYITDYVRQSGAHEKDQGKSKEGAGEKAGKKGTKQSEAAPTEAKKSDK